MKEKTEQKIYQVSTLQALAMGYTRAVINVGELLRHGDTGLGTFEDVDGEMILVDGVCYRAMKDGTVKVAPPEMGVPFSSVTFLNGQSEYEMDETDSIEKLKTSLDLKIEENFGLNSMHIVRIDGDFKKISARSEEAYRSHHITLKDVLANTQEDFYFGELSGTLICVYYPDYMDGINAPGWHLHFISADRQQGGHVFDLHMKKGSVKMDKISNIHIQIPTSAAFDTYSLKDASQDEIKQVEQGKG